MTHDTRFHEFNKDDWNSDLTHQANMDEIREQAKHCVFIRYAWELHKMRGVPWEHAITMVALAMSQDRERLLKEFTKQLEHSTQPYFFLDPLPGHEQSKG